MSTVVQFDDLYINQEHRHMMVVSHSNSQCLQLVTFGTDTGMVFLLQQ